MERKISAAHQLNLPYESGCNRLHGHNYHVVVRIMSEQLNGDTMVIDYSHIKPIIDSLDHQNINDFIQPSTAENIAKYIHDAIMTLRPFLKVEIEVCETDNSSMTYSL